METFLVEALKVLNNYSRWILWNLFLAFIPLALSFWLFHWSSRSRSIVWWIGFLVFIVFLPNAPYLLTDVIHLIDAFQDGYSLLAIILILLPLHVLAIFAGFEVYVMSVMNQSSYLYGQGAAKLIVWTELAIHALCAVGIYLGRFKRFNSWDLLIQPNVLIKSVFDDLVAQNFLGVVLLTFVLISVLYWLMKRVNVKLILYIYNRSFNKKNRKNTSNSPKRARNNNVYPNEKMNSSHKNNTKTYNIEEFKMLTYLYDWQPENTLIVNFSGVVVQLEEIVNFLKQEVLIKDICQKILNQKIIEKTARERGICITPEEIQLRMKRLEKSVDMTSWLTEQMITVNDWEAGIRSQLLAQKVAEHLFDQDVESFFEHHCSMFDQFILYQIVVDYEIVATKIFSDLIEKRISFFEAAHIYDIDEQRRSKCGYEGHLSLGGLQPELATAVLKAPVGEILGPFKTEHGYHLLMVEKFISEQLTSEKRQEILEMLFNEWLARELKYMLHISYWIPKQDY